MPVGDYWDNAEADDAFSEARQRIMAAKVSGEKRLTLGGLKTLSVLPPDISDLSALSHLVLHNLNVIDLAPLASLANLRSLRLSQLPASDITPLASLHSLKELSLGAGVPVTDITTIANIRRLRYLSLEYNRYVTNISAVSNLTYLLRLDLMCSSVSDVSPLHGLAGLEHLDLRYTEVSDLAPLSDLSALKVLWLGDTKISDVGPLSGLIELRSLDLEHTLVSDVRPLCGLTKLQQLVLQSTLVSSLAPLADLTDLIDACVIPDEDEPDEPDSTYEPSEEGFGLHYLGTPVADFYPFHVFVQLNRPQRTIHTINHIRAEKGLPLHYPEGYEPPIIRSKRQLLVLTEGDTDVSTLETAWQKLYPHEERYFELRASLGAKNIQITLNNERLFENSRQMIVGILDFDEGYNQWKGIWGERAEDIVQETSRCLMRKHPSGRAWAMLLPVPPHRADFASAKMGGRSILSIEFLFEDKDIPQRFVRIEPLPRGASIPVFHSKKKEEFAQYVKTLPKESFGAFAPIFERWREIVNGVL